MKIHFRHAFDCRPDQLWKILDDPAFDQRLERVSNVRRIQTFREDDGEVMRTVHECVSLHELPAYAARALGSKRLVYDQHNTLTRSTNEMRWGIVPRMLTDRIEAGGVTRIFEEGDKTIREVHGEIVVSVPLIGRRLEKLLKGKVETSYENAAGAMRQYLQENRA